MKLGLTFASAALALVALSSTTRAVELQPGQGQVAATQVSLSSGLTPLANSTGNFAGVNAQGTTTFTGSFSTSVFNEGSANSLGGLTFVYDFTNNGPDLIERLTATNFAGFRVDVNYDGTGPLQGNTAPSTFSRLSSGTIGFNFGNGVAPGTTGSPSGSAYLVIRTNALGFTNTGSFSIIDGSTADIAGFAPTNALPEPGTMVAALVGLTAIGGLRLRRRAK